MPPVGMIQNHVASLLAVEDEAGFLKCSHCLTARNDWKRGHLRGDADFDDVGGWDGQLLGLADLDDALDGLLDISQCLVARLSLRHTAREGGTLSYNVAILSCRERNQILVRHGVSPFAYTDKLSQDGFLLPLFQPQASPSKRSSSPVASKSRASSYPPID